MIFFDRNKFSLCSSYVNNRYIRTYFLNYDPRITNEDEAFNYDVDTLDFFVKRETILAIKERYDHTR